MIFLFLIFLFPLGAREICFEGGLTLPVTLEHAVTEEQIAWGLMQRRELPENSGMTFTYPRPQILQFWMFNCFIDISVAFLDERKVIREIFAMKAYPWKMDPLRPVRKVADFDKYSISDPVARFFISHGVESSLPTRYALEMNVNWFKDHRIKPGDAVWWVNSSPKGCVIRTIDMSPYLPLTEPLVIRFSDAAFRSLKFPKESRFYEVQFCDAVQKVVGKVMASHHQPVLCYQPVASIIITPIGKPK